MADTFATPGYGLPDPNVQLEEDPVLRRADQPAVPDINARVSQGFEDASPVDQPAEGANAAPAQPDDAGEGTFDQVNRDAKGDREQPGYVSDFMETEDPVDYILRLDENHKRAKMLRAQEDELSDLGLLPNRVERRQAEMERKAGVNAARLGFTGPDASETARSLAQPPEETKSTIRLTPDQAKAQAEADVPDFQQQLEQATQYRQKVWENATKEAERVHQMFGIPMEEVPPEMRDAYMRGGQREIARLSEGTFIASAGQAELMKNYRKALDLAIKAVENPSVWGPKYTRSTHYVAAFTQAAGNMAFGISKAAIILGEMISDPDLSEGRSDVRRAVDDVQKAFNEAMPVDSYHAQTQFFLTDLAQAGGSMSVFLMGGLIAQSITGSAAAGGWAAGILGAGVESSALFEEAERYDASAWQKYFSFLSGIGIGATEALPISRMLGRANITTGGGIMRALSQYSDAAVRAGIENALQEAGQGMLEDIAAKVFDQDRTIDFARAFREGVAGGASGMIMQMLLGAGSRRGGQQQAQDVQAGIDAERLLADMRRAEAQRRFAELQGAFDQDTSLQVAAQPEAQPQQVETQSRISFEMQPGEGAPNQALTPRLDALQEDDRIAIADAVTGAALERATEFSGIENLNTIVHGVGVWDGVANPSATGQVKATPQQARKAAAYLGYVLQQTEVWVNRVKPLTSRAKEFAIDMVDTAGVALSDARSAHALFEKIAAADPTGLVGGYQNITTEDGKPGIRILVNKDAIASAKVSGVKGAQNRLKAALENEIAEALRGENYELEVDFQGAEIDILRNDWTEKKNGEDYLQVLEDKEHPAADIDRARQEFGQLIEGEITAAEARQGEAGAEAQQDVEELRAPIRLTGRDGLEYRVFENPTEQQAKTIMTQPDRLPQMRFLRLVDGTLYAWDAHKAVHGDVMVALGLTHDDVMARGNVMREAEVERLLQGTPPAEAIDLAKQFQEYQPDISFQQVAQDQPVQMRLFDTPVDTPAFEKWFEGSEVVDNKGEPLVVYHSTGAETLFTEFKISGIGAHFGTKAAADERGHELRSFDRLVGRRVQETRRMPLFLSIKNAIRLPDMASLTRDENGNIVEIDDDADSPPLAWEGIESDVGEYLLDKGIIDIDEFEDKGRDDDGVRELLQEKGYDGIVYENAVEDKGSDSWIIFEPTQVKSVNNQGTFDPSEPDISFQQVNLREQPIQPNLFGTFPSLSEIVTDTEWWNTNIATGKPGPGSKVVDSDGNPMPVYHGTFSDIPIFDPHHSSGTAFGFHFGTQKAAGDRMGDRGFFAKDQNIMPVYLSIQNPLEMEDVGEWHNSVTIAYELNRMPKFAGNNNILNILIEAKEIEDQYMDAGFEGSEVVVMDQDSPWTASPDNLNLLRELQWELQAAGHDGIKYNNKAEDAGSISWIAFEPEQVKSAIGNQGTFDLNDPDIVHQQVAQRDVQPLPLFPKITETGFDRWWRDSKVVDPDGTPRVVYHGTTDFGFRAFDKTKTGNNSSVFGVWEVDRAGLFFAENRDFAKSFTDQNSQGPGGRGVYDVYLSIQNPAEIERIADHKLTEMVNDYLETIGGVEPFNDVWSGISQSWELFDDELGQMVVGGLKKAGYDGAVIEETNHETGESEKVWIAFDPEQIKSVDNDGAFDPSNPDIFAQQAYKLRTDETVGMLPQDHRRYFKFDEQTEELPLQVIKPIRARPEGIEAAAVFMRRAYESGAAGRQGLSVRDDGDGTYTLLDGNSTYAVAKANGWDTIPVRVLTDAQFAAEEKAAKEAKAKIPEETRRTEAAKAFLPQGNGVVAKRDIPDKYRPYVDEAFSEKQAEWTVDQLVEGAKKGRPELVRLIRDIAKKTGARGLAGPNKKPETIIDKVKRKGYKHAGSVKDVVRGTIEVETPEQADQIVEELAKRRAVLDEEWKAYPADYVDRKLSVVLKNGMTAEIILIEKDMSRVKEPGHYFYEMERPTDAKERYGTFQVSMAKLKQQALYRTAIKSAVLRWGAWSGAYDGTGIVIPSSPSNMPSTVSGASQSNATSGSSRPGVPNIAANLSGVSSRPESQTSSQTEISVQPSSPSLNTPARPSGITTAGRDSISQNVGSDQGGVGTATMLPNIRSGIDQSKRVAPTAVGERSRPEGGIPDTGQPGSDVSISKMSSNLTRLLQLVVRQGRLAAKGRDVLGQYQRSTGTIRMRNMQDLSTRVHEAAHSLHDNRAQILDQFVTDHFEVIKKIADEWYGGDTNTKAMQRREGFAEFFRIYVLARGFGTQGANAIPGLEQANADFDALLEAEAPQIKRGLDTIREQFDAWLQIPDTQAIKSMLVTAKRDGVIGSAIEEIRARAIDDSRREMLRGTGSWLDDKISSFYAQAIDSGEALRRTVDGLLNESERNTGRAANLPHHENPYVLYTLGKSNMGAAQVQLKYGVRGYHSADTVSRGLRDGILIAMGEQAGTRGSAVFDAKRLEDFNAYLVARRARAEYARYEAGEIPFPPLGGEYKLGGIEQAITDFETKYGDAFRDGAEIVYEYNQALWQKLYDAGLISEELFTKGAAKVDYVPLMRDMSDRGKSFGQNVMTVGKGNLIKAFKGSSRDIINPLDAIMNKTFTVEQAIATNEVRRALAKLGETVGTGSGRYVERIPANQMQAHNVNVLEVMSKALKDVEIDPVDAQEMYLTLEAAFNKEATVTTFSSTVTNEAGENIVFYYENGERRAMQVADGKYGEELMQVLASIGRENMPLFVDTLAMTSNAFRAGITAWPDFLLVNYFRDQLQSWLQQDTFIPFITGAKGVIDEVRSAKSAQSYNAMGGIMGGMMNASLHEARVMRDIKAMEKKGYLGEVFGDIKAVTRGGGLRSIMGAVAKVTELTETGTRVGLFEKAMKKYMADGLSEYEAGIAAAYIAVDNMNFGRGGSRTLAVRRLVPFLNAQLQGLDKLWRTLSAAEGGRRRKGMSWKMLISIAVKDMQGMGLNAQEQQNVKIARQAWRKMVALSFIYMAIAALQEDDPDYQQVSTYLKSTGTPIMLDDGKFLWLPKPFEWAVMGNALEAAYKSGQGDGRAWERFWKGLRYTLIPPSEIPILHTSTELINNVDTFRGGPIVPQWMERFEAHEQYTAYTSELAKRLGAATNLSPMKIDHFINNMFASAGRDMLGETNRILNENRPEMGLEDHFFTRRWIRDSKRGSNVVKDFYEYAGGVDGKLTKAYATYKKKIDQGRELDAADFLSKMTTDEQVYALLNVEPFEAKHKRLHPMRRARDYMGVVSQMRREIISGDGLESTEFKGETEEIVMTAKAKATVEDMLQEMSIREARNALVLMKDRGYANREFLPVDESFDLLAQYEPRVAEELQRRLEKAKVYNWDAVRYAWPELKDRLLHEGREASLNDLLVGATGP